MRGRETTVKCDNCGRIVPKNKAVAVEKPIVFSTDMRTGNDIKFFEKRKVYYCISCAKHLGIFEKKKHDLKNKNR